MNSLFTATSQCTCIFLCDAFFNGLITSSVWPETLCWSLSGKIVKHVCHLRRKFAPLLRPFVRRKTSFTSRACVNEPHGGTSIKHRVIFVELVSSATHQQHSQGFHGYLASHTFITKWMCVAWASGEGQTHSKSIHWKHCPPRKHCLPPIICGSLRGLGRPPRPPTQPLNPNLGLVYNTLSWSNFSALARAYRHSSLTEVMKWKGRSSLALLSWVNLLPCLWVD